MLTGSKEEGMAVIEMLTGNPKAEQCLDEALKLFKRAEQVEGKICSFNIAKCLYEKAVCIMDSYGNKDYAPTSKKLYYQSRKDEVLAILKEVKERVKSVEVINN